MKNLIYKVLAPVLLGLLALPVHSAIIYDVSSTTRVNCTNSPHGLWTNTDMGSPSCDANYFDIRPGTTLTINDDNTAHLFGSAINPDDVIASIDLTLGGYTDDHTTIGEIKNGGGGTPSLWDFFTTIAGDIEINGFTYIIDGFAGGTSFQLGDGANDKTSAFGGSGWVTSSGSSSACGGDTGDGGSGDEGDEGGGSGDEGDDGTSSTTCGGMTSHHWDLNLDLTARVPAPGTLALLVIGLLGFGFKRSRK